MDETPSPICCVCLESLRSSDVVAVLPCQHCLHMACAVHCNVCPLCRGPNPYFFEFATAELEDGDNEDRQTVVQERRVPQRRTRQFCVLLISLCAATFFVWMIVA